MITEAQIMDFPINKYPTLAVTDHNVLLQSLGSFWNMLFQERGTIKGYTIGQAEEMVQHYYNLVETIRAYSVNDIPVFHTEKWYPLVIKKSEFAVVPLLFNADNIVFGHQPSTDPYYSDVIFRFGFPKSTESKIYTFKVPAEFKGFSVISNRIIAPSRLFINNVDVSLKDNVLYFNKNIFELADLPKISLLAEDGVPATFTDYDGLTQDDQLIVLWAYHAKTDTDNLFTNFGYLFDLLLDNNKFYKDILHAIIHLYTSGPTVNAIKALAASFIGVTPVIEAVETIEEIIHYTSYSAVITDRHVYKFDNYYTLLPEINIGSIVKAGDILVDAVQYCDNVSSRRWWGNKAVPKVSVTGQTPHLALPPHMFMGNYKHSLIFKNDAELFTADANGNLFFPVEGDPADVRSFNAYLTSKGDEIKAAVGLTNGGAVVINPLDFIFDNFLKSGTALIKFNFKNIDAASVFISFFHTIKDCLPKHVFFIFYFDFMLDQEAYNLLNKSTPITLDNTTVISNADGTNDTGFLTVEAGHGNYMTSVKDRLFTMALNFGPVRPFDHTVASNGTADTDVLAVSDGKVTQTITLGATTKQINNLLLLDFS